MALYPSAFRGKCRDELSKRRSGEVAIPTTAADIPYVLEQAATCLSLAEECNDDEISARLRELAQAFADRARRLGADPNLIPCISLK
jgi:hypothetical protein